LHHIFPKISSFEVTKVVSKISSSKMPAPGVPSLCFSCGRQGGWLTSWKLPEFADVAPQKRNEFKFEVPQFLSHIAIHEPSKKFQCF